MAIWHSIRQKFLIASSRAVTYQRCSFLSIDSNSVKETDLQTQQRRKGTVYIHWPFCSKLCTYCNFNKYFRDNVDHDSMTKCLIKEVQNMLRMSSIKHISSIYFGGGTPSLAKPSTIEAVIDAVVDAVSLDSDVEISLEANPTSAELDKLKDFKAAGVNRLSLGIQSLVDADLHSMNRNHTADQAKSVLAATKSIFSERINVDLIFGRPGQTLIVWKKELEEIIEVCSNHLSLYQLTIEPGTALYKSVKRGDTVLLDSDVIADMYEVAVTTLESQGLLRYEVSNFSRTGFESQHNQAYWSGSDYIGIGPGAHSRFRSPDCEGYVRSVNILEPNAWMLKIKDNNNGLGYIRKMSNYERLEEVLASSLRTSAGLTTEIWRLFSSILIEEVFSPNCCNRTNLLQYYENDLLKFDERGLRATPRGLNVLDSMLPELCVTLESKLLS